MRIENIIFLQLSCCIISMEYFLICWSGFYCIHGFSSHGYLHSLVSLQIRTIVKPGCSQEVLKAALSVMASVTEVLSVMSSSPINGQSSL